VTREQVLQQAAAAFDSGALQALLASRVACPSESQEPARAPELRDYLASQLAPALQAMGFEAQIHDNPLPGEPPLMIATRREAGAAFGVLSYGHGDVVRGYAAQWQDGLDPWRLQIVGDRWYGRGTADNKGQHTINLLALQQVLAARGGRLGFDLTLLVEMGEETGSPGLREFCRAQREALRADLFLASDGPRLAAERPTLFLGSRGAFNFDLVVDLRPGGHHSGNWGGLLRNPGVRLAHAIASMVDARGRVLVPGLRPPPLTQRVREALRGLAFGSDPGDPAIDPDWGEPGLTPAERVIGWNSLEVLAFKTGNPQAPVNAIPGHAQAHAQLRYVVGSDSAHFLRHLREHLDRLGFDDVQLRPSGTIMEASRLDPTDPWVDWALQSMGGSSGKTPVLLPNLGGSLPNDIFADDLGLPTLWVPHSYPACSQHAPNEHLLGSVAREALQLMAGLWWDLGEAAAREAARAPRPKARMPV
jgi:acetylornithine deacetylase/succinyl-diaminopimelate desuccinylase-like protein